MSEQQCVIGLYCRRHGFVHGAEAEELRERLGKINSGDVRRILDDVDARDSLAFIEVTPSPDLSVLLGEVDRLTSTDPVAVQLIKKLAAAGCDGAYPEGCTRDDEEIPLYDWCINCLAARLLRQLRDALKERT